MIDVETGQQIRPEQESVTRVLEVGCGVNPAFRAGGEVFVSGSVEYTGIDLPEEVAENAIYYHYMFKKDRYVPGQVVKADCAQMPFQDEQFDIVMMRSLFGQFIGGRLGNPRSWKGRKITTLGMMEAFRVLMPGGTIVIAEENTPFSPRDVEDFLLDVGFKPTEFEQMQEDHWEEVNPNSHWLQLRGKYYNDEPVQPHRQGFGDSPPYILIASKPFGVMEVYGIHPNPREHGPGVETIPVEREYKHGAPIEAEPITPEF